MVLYSLLGSCVVVTGGAGVVVVVKRSQIGEKLMVKDGFSEQQAGTYWKPKGRRDGVSCLPSSHWTQGKRLLKKSLGLKTFMRSSKGDSKMFPIPV